jgi:hypothetical protein
VAIIRNMISDFQPIVFARCWFRLLLHLLQFIFPLKDRVANGMSLVSVFGITSTLPRP